MRHRFHEVTRCQEGGVSCSIRSVVDWRGNGHGSSGLAGQLWATENSLLQLGKRHPLSRVQIKNSSQNVVEIIREGQDRFEEAAVLHVSTESGIVHGSPLPGVTATGQVDQDDAKGPDIIGSRGVASIRARVGLLALGGHVEGGSTAKVRSVVVLGGKAEVGKLQSDAIRGDQDVLGLEIPVVDTNRMAKLNSLKNLEESVLSQGILSNVESLFGDSGEKIAFRTELHDNESAIS